MEWIDEGFARHWNGLSEHLTAGLRPMVLSFFSGVPPDDAGTIADLVCDGKKLRGCLVLAMCDALGGPLEGAMTAAVGVECVQAASLIHDDLVDDDAVRRDRPATWIVKGGRRAVLLGDLIFATALHRSAEAGREQVLVLAKAIARVATGAYREPLDAVETHALLQQQPRRGGVYEHLIQTKTGALFAAAAELGAVAAAAPPALCAAAADFGARLGEAYQMADDLADLVSLPEGAAPSPQQAAALEVLVAYLTEAAPELARPARIGAVPASTARASADTVVDSGPDNPGDLAALLQREIQRRLSLARQALGAFPEGPRLAFLRGLPDALVRPVAAGERCALPRDPSPYPHRDPAP